MAYLFSFERLEVWKLSIELAEKVYTICREFPPEEKYGLTSQLKRAIVSVSSNLAEGSSRGSLKDQAKFTTIAYSSLMESLSQVTLAQRLGWVNNNDYQTFREKTKELANKINALKISQVKRLEEPYIEDQTPTPPPNDSTIQQFDDSPFQPFNDSTIQRFNDSTTPYYTANSLKNKAQHLNTSTPQHLYNNALPYYAHPSSIIDEGAEIGANTKIWHFAHIMPEARIGEACNIGQNVFIAGGVVLGKNVKVQNNVSVYKGVTCEDDVFLGPSMVFTNVINPRSAVNRKNEYQPTLVQRGASIGANATVVCGHTIGQYAFIGAGAVVTKDVPDFALMVGNPARQVGWMSKHGYRLTFNTKGVAVCPESGETYTLTKGKVQLSEAQAEPEAHPIPNKAKES